MSTASEIRDLVLEVQQIEKEAGRLELSLRSFIRIRIKDARTNLGIQCPLAWCSAPWMDITNVPKNRRHLLPGGVRCPSAACDLVRHPELGIASWYSHTDGHLTLADLDGEIV